jgi:hypothetical protein
MKKMHRGILRILLLAFGTVSLVIGILGIFLPILPTTPFIFISGLCFAKSSRRLHRWLLTNKITGKSYQRILNKEGITLRMKIVILGIAWTMLGIAAVFLAHSKAMRIVYPSLGAIKTVLFFTVIKTHKKENSPIDSSQFYVQGDQS